MKPSAFSPKNNGVYRLPADAASLRAVAVDAGLCWSGIDLQRARGKRALLNAFARGLKFPDTFGANWDALADCLQDMSWLPEQGRVLALRGAADFAVFKSDEHAVLLEILGGAAMYWRQQGRVFIVLSDAAGLPAYPAR
jgi:hypothetical protein